MYVGLQSFFDLVTSSTTNSVLFLEFMLSQVEICFSFISSIIFLILTLVIVSKDRDNKNVSRVCFFLSVFW